MSHVCLVALTCNSGRPHFLSAYRISVRNLFPNACESLNDRKSSWSGSSALHSALRLSHLGVKEAAKGWSMMIVDFDLTFQIFSPFPIVCKWDAGRKSNKSFESIPVNHASSQTGLQTGGKASLSLSNHSSLKMSSRTANDLLPGSLTPLVKSFSIKSSSTSQFAKCLCSPATFLHVLGELALPPLPTCKAGIAALYASFVIMETSGHPNTSPSLSSDIRGCLPTWPSWECLKWVSMASRKLLGSATLTGLDGEAFDSHSETTACTTERVTSFFFVKGVVAYRIFPSNQKQARADFPVRSCTETLTTLSPIDTLNPCPIHCPFENLKDNNQMTQVRVLLRQPSSFRAKLPTSHTAHAQATVNTGAYSCLFPRSYPQRIAVRRSNLVQVFGNSIAPNLAPVTLPLRRGV